MVVGSALILVGVLVGFGFAWQARRLKARVEAAQSWTEVPAIIQTARLQKVGKTSSAPSLTYTYSVAGRTYTGKRLQFGGLNMTRQEAEEVLAAYPEGATTTVRYDPQRHDFAVLRLAADSKGFLIAGIGIGLAFAVAGLVVAVSG
ncbi:MAG: DUF3592 domain-containing protein [Caulobacterales bacterium]|nr:DUF3592 domain-containing protein [Caulobacterales bacterium]